MKIMAEVHLYHGLVRAERLKRGWSQRKLAEEAGCTTNAVWALEALHKNAPSIRAVEKIAQALEIPAEDILAVKWPEGIPTRYRQISEISEMALELFAERAKTRALSFGGMGKLDWPLDVEDLDLVMKDLSPHQRHYVNLRFGLNGEKEHTLDEIGRKVDLTRESVRLKLLCAMHAMRATAEVLTSEEGPERLRNARALLRQIQSEVRRAFAAARENPVKQVK